MFACRYATFAELAGVDPTDHRAALAGLPPIDSVSMVPVIFGKTVQNRPRMELAIGTEPRPSNLSTAPPCASISLPRTYDDSLHGAALPSAREGNCSSVIGLIVDEGDDGLWKLITGDEKQYVWTGPHYPNSSTDFNSQDPVYTKHCGNTGCLFNLEADPFEKEDLAWAFPEKAQQMVARIEELERSAFNPDRGTTDPRACEAALGRWQGFWGYWLE